MPIQNHEALNVIYKNSSQAYRDRVPVATQANISDVYDSITDPTNGNIWNEFETGLVNLVGNQIVRDWTWQNPFAIFKKDGLLPMGAVIEEIAFDLTEAQGYDVRDDNVFKIQPQKVYSAFHKVNRKDRYQVTILKEELRAAFNSPTGLNDFINRKLSIPGKSDSYDEYLIMRNLLGLAAEKNDLHNVQVTIADPSNPTPEELRKLSTQIRATAKKMGVVPTGRYNSAKVKTVSRPEDLVLFLTPDMVAAMDVNVLADAFNISRADFASRVIELDEIPIPGVHAILVDTSWFVAGDYLREVTNFWNAKTFANNYYLHHWAIYSVSPFGNAVMFGEAPTSTHDEAEATLTGITAHFEDAAGDTQTTFSYGDKLDIVVMPEGTVSPQDVDLSVPGAATFEIKVADAAGEAIRKTSRTYVDRYGRVYVQKGLEAGATVTVDATSTIVDREVDGTVNEPLKATATLTVV